MKYYSTQLSKLFDSVEELETAEKKYTTKLEAEKIAKEKREAERKAKEEEREKDWGGVVDQYKLFVKAFNDYKKKYGQITTYSNNFMFPDWINLLFPDGKK